ncbi:MAG: TIGR03086 family metal-binding protein [Acidimicrobiales bacterium]|nr:TIGR03086 family metal-binding protein [Acidimicrobiales bacterium]
MTETADTAASDAPSAELLITLGRDREAVAAATREHGASTLPTAAPTPNGGTMDGPQQLDEIIPLLKGVVDGVSAEQLDAATPCGTYTVRGVLEHMLNGATAFAPAFRGEPSPASAGGAGTGDLRAQWRAAMDDLLDSVHAPGAQERTIAAPIGVVPGSVFARFVAFDGLVHGWDLATATGQEYGPREELVDEVAGFARQALAPEMRDGDTFKAETDVPADAGSLERLVAFSGRTIPT